MKARFFTAFGFGLALLALPFVGGCSETGADLSSSLISSANAEPVVAAINTNAPAENPAPPAAEAELAAAEAEDLNATLPEPAPTSEKKLPLNLKPTGPTAELIKLAQSGVDEAVMLNYITNATSLFVLNSDDIIYFNDLGVAGNIITAMMQHDQVLKAAGPNPVAQPSQVATQAAAPTYQNPPQPALPPQPQPAPVEAPPPAANVTDNYFNEALAPYGTWVDVEGYGRCWQPTVVVVNSGWRPYCDRGRWIYSDCGWYWLSDYSWGATTFHYGRWLSHPRWGWCWWPDRVWAPSWVSWRYSDDYCGWAPLPPAACYRPGFGFSYYGGPAGVNFAFGLGSSSFTFVSWGNFHNSHSYHNHVPPQQVAQIYNHTTIVNSYGVGKNGTVISHGIPVARVRDYTRTELRPVSIRDHNEPGSLRGERLERDGRSLVVNRPRLPESTAAKPLTAQPLRTETARDHRGQSTATSSTVNPAQKENQETLRRRDERLANPNRDLQRADGRTATSAPLRGNSLGNANHTPPSPATATAPAPNSRPTANAPGAQPKSLVVIGRRDANSARDRNADNERLASATHTELPANAPQTTRNWSAPTPRPPVPQYAAPQRIQPSAAPTYTPPAYQLPRVAPQENRYTPSQPSYNPRPSPGPSFSAPRPSPTVSAPSYTPSPAPSAPAPAVSAPRTAPAESRPAPSSNNRTESGGRNRP